MIALIILLLFVAFALVIFANKKSGSLSDPNPQLGGAFPPRWEYILKQNVPLAYRLTDEQQQRLRKMIRLFIRDVDFEGAGGLRITDEIRVTIAANACLMVLGNGRLFRRLRSIIIYPTMYRPVAHDHTGNLMVSDNYQLGESWGDGYVVLAWDAVVEGARDPDNGNNVVIHEFAHQLDQEDVDTDGNPIGDEGWDDGYATGSYWAEQLLRDFGHLRAKLEQGEDPVLDEYGAESPVEFFAVATETFFEKGRELKQHYPELYKTLQEFYQLDPAAWR